jgi:hypothetical protein
MLHPHVTLTFYPAPYPSESGGIVMLDGDHYLAESAPFVASLTQSVQRSDLLRSHSPALNPRGGRALPMEWEEVRRIESPGEALATALGILDEMPDTTGWVRIEIPSLERAWAVTPAAVRSIGWDHDPRKRLLRLRWALETGPATEITATVPEEDYLLLETGFELLWEDGDTVALESFV